MTEANIPRIVVAATQSGSGKTTVVTGLLAALRKRGMVPQSYKIGPDYIDPGYHERASGRPGNNLDTWLVPADKIGAIFGQSAAQADIAVIEGVMGLYDGGRAGISSTAELAKLLRAPVVLVLDVKSMGDSAAAIALGFKTYDPDVQIAGVILNRLGSDNHRRIVETALARLGIPVLGAIFRTEQLQMPERHLGLVPTAENTQTKIDAIGEIIGSSVALDAVIKIARDACPLPLPPPKASEQPPLLTIAVARDEAFSFYYPASLAVLEDLGARILYFSPLADERVPEADGILIGGGFPEMFAAQLAGNTSMLASIRRAADRGMPVYAECGGFMYLTRALQDFAGHSYAMAGLVPGTCAMNDKLQTVGYVEAEMLQDTVLGPAGTVLRGHEFHFSSQLPEGEDAFPWAFCFTKNRTGQRYKGGFARGRILASYLHLHFAGNPRAAAAFVAACREYRESLPMEEE